MLTLFTARFQMFRPVQGTPVRITRGAPRFKLPYQLTHTVPELAPAAAYFNSPRPAFAAAYRADLTRLGAGQIAERLGGIAQQAGDHRLVLLCFEDLAKPELWCHRRIFADWWSETTGDPVRELGPMAGPSPYEQGTLL
ncbi:hypothetical protein GCM10010193_57610 [Kitasatospora atroaurantiaca]|uniref:DUF488 domain-containing protein n=1 Tax=Kitasatospora atroaurantiaca TaxID=285545 RepID=A0A561EN09_9ACTN|nr:DUF488 domain-containing protein [Kitasatospora atroaurantiaca]TWE17006.1 hypothetical protein FB465_2003 [Kitasatospora atroaurantiaca]